MTGKLFLAAAACLAAAVVATAADRPAPSHVEGPLPRLLSETGLYAEGDTLRIDPRNRPFSPQYPLWTDGARKSRWVRLPAGATIEARDVDDWDFPVGTRFWKQFAFGARKVETRMLWRSSATGWTFASYRWNEAQTDAELVPADGFPNAADVAPVVATAFRRSRTAGRATTTHAPRFSDSRRCSFPPTAIHSRRTPSRSHPAWSRCGRSSRNGSSSRRLWN